jgi:hypothetical protein
VEWIHLAQDRVQWRLGSCEHGAGYRRGNVVGSYSGRAVFDPRSGTPSILTEVIANLGRAPRPLLQVTVCQVGTLELGT